MTKRVTKNGISLNTTRKGVSITGLKGLRFRLSQSGLSVTATIPGTGLSKTKVLLSKKGVRWLWLFLAIFAAFAIYIAMQSGFLMNS